MGLFDKKFCSVCGGKIGIFGNRKLEDGNLCKECASLLSPWFSDRKHSTVEEIKEQLKYREENKNAVAAFRATRTLGTDMKVLLDEDAGKFMVTSSSKISEANPDVISFEDVTGCTVSADESRTEVKRKDAEGKMVSYIPAHYKYRYDLYCTINVNNPYFDEIRFRLNRDTIELGGSTGVTIAPDPTKNVEYRSAEALGEEIKDTLTGVRQKVREDAKPKSAVICPHCGATTMPDPNGRCEYCGMTVNE